MDDFDSFKESRLKMDPSSREMNDHQWKQAFEAHLRARQLVSGGGESATRRRRRSASKSHASSRGHHTPSAVSESGSLRNLVRSQTAYGDLRMVVNVLAWVAIAVVVVAAFVSLSYYTSIAVAIVAILRAVFEVIAIAVVRLVVQVIIDIPDVALYRASKESPSESTPDSEHADA